MTDALLAFLPSVGVPELLILLAIAVLILGPKQIPKAARSLGKGIRGFRESVSGRDGEDEEEEPPKLTEETETGS